jgi:hypothetical protein
MKEFTSWGNRVVKQEIEIVDCHGKSRFVFGRFGYNLILLFPGEKKSPSGMCYECILTISLQQMPMFIPAGQSNQIKYNPVLHRVSRDGQSVNNMSSYAVGKDSWMVLAEKTCKSHPDLS